MRLDSTTNPMDMILSKFQETVEDKGAWCAAVHRVAESDMIKQLNNILYVVVLCSSTLLLSSVSLFMTTTLNPLSGRLLISISFRSLSEPLSCSFYWIIFLCIFILPKCVCAPLIQVNQQSLPVLKEWLNLEDVLRVQRCNPTYTRARCRASSMWALCAFLLS